MHLKILIVDDSSVMRSIIRQTLTLMNIDIAQIFEASNGEEGLQLLSANPVDYIFIDVNMPTMNGIEMLKKIRSNPDIAQLQVLMITSERNQVLVDEIRSLNAEIVHKPFTPEHLRDNILRIINRKPDIPEKS